MKLDVRLAVPAALLLAGCAAPRTVPQEAGTGQPAPSHTQAPTAPPVDLLRATPATVYAAFGYDVDPYVMFHVPADAHVDHLELPAGYDHAGDVRWFDHLRIAEVVVRRTGDAPAAPHGPTPPCPASARDEPGHSRRVALDPDKLGLQRVPIDERGGQYCMWITRTVPGKDPKASHLVLPELRVLGQPGHEVRAKRTAPPGYDTLMSQLGHEGDADPDADDGPLRPTADTLEPELAVPFATAAALCTAELADLGGLNADCKKVALPVPFRPAAPVLEATGLEVRTDRGQRRVIVVRTAAGYFATPMVYFQELNREGPSGDPAVAAVESLQVSSGYVVLAQTWRADLGRNSVDEATVPRRDAGDPRQLLRRQISWCHWPGGTLTCFDHAEAALEPAAVATAPGTSRVGVARRLPFAWSERWEISADGALLRGKPALRDHR